MRARRPVRPSERWWWLGLALYQWRLKKKVNGVRIYLWINSEGCGFGLGIEKEGGGRQLRGNLRI